MTDRCFYSRDDFELHTDEFGSSCKKYHVPEMHVFGSILSDNFTKEDVFDLLEVQTS